MGFIRALHASSFKWSRRYTSSSFPSQSSEWGGRNTIWERTKVGLSLVTLGLGSTVAWVYLSDSRAGIYPSLVMPLIHYFVDAETSHKWAIQLAKYGLVPKQTTQDDEALMTELWGKRIGNPVGLAAGFDKDAEGIDSLIGFGFGTVEIGSVTPLPQPGNPQPRMFRLTQDNAVINRYGFNSKGHEQVKRHLILRLNSYLKRQLAPSNAYPTYDEKQQLHFNLPNGIPRSLKPDRLLGVNLGKNKTSPAESNDDYINGVKTLGPFADYLVVNISSPNTPGLRSLQRREPMLKLLEDVRSTRDKYLQHKPPLLVKVAPDLTEEELLDIAHVVKEAKMDGIIISNTTISRPESLKSDPSLVKEAGGLSGPPAFPLALRAVSSLYKATDGEIPIIGCGGISSGADAVAFAKAGASLVQLYTSLGYRGPGIVVSIKEEIVALLKNEGKNWKDIVGSDHRHTT